MGKLVLPAIVIVSLIAPHVALACLCGPRPSYCEQPPVAGDSANLAVFVGTVESVIRRDGEQHVRFHVEERFVGAGEASFEAFTRLSICDPVFEAGQRYLVEAGKSSDRWRSGACSMTTLAAQAAPEIEALRAWQQGREPVRAIQGVVLDATRRSSNQVGAAGIRIRLIDPRARLETRTDTEGKFRFNGLAKGTYSIAVDEPGWIAEGSWNTATAQTIDLSKSSCGHVSFSMRQTWVSVRGHLAAPSGVSTAAVPIEVIPLTPIEGARHARNWTTTASGEFQLDDLETGDYLLALNVRRSPANPRSPVNSTALPSRFPPTYYPGTPNRAEAKVIHLERGKLT